MPTIVTTGTILKCNFGSTPSLFQTFQNMDVKAIMPIGCEKDIIPIVNILPFGMCKSILNPTVAAATLSHLGVLTPMPCIPVIAGKWSNACKKVKVKGSPVINEKSQCQCVFGGKIEVDQAIMKMVQVD